MTLVVGIDPGLTVVNPCGFAVVDTDTMDLLYTDAFRPVGDAWSARVQSIAGRVQWLITTVKPELIAYELPATLWHYWTVIQLAHVGGAIVAIAALYDVPVVGVNPTEAKQALTGGPHATKEAMIASAVQIFGKELRKDVADAAAVALAGEALVRRAALTMEVRQ